MSKIFLVLLFWKSLKANCLCRVQLNAKDNNTFSPRTISLPKESYGSMVRTMRLPLRGIETSAVVGPFFWCSVDDDDEDDSHLRT